MDAHADRRRLTETAGSEPRPPRSLDREIARLALPALVALVAEPLYILADTAIVGHIGTPQLGGLGVASAILLTGYSLFIFLAYGTTGAVARRLGAGDKSGAAHDAIQGLWMAVGLAVAVGGLLAVTGPGLIGLLGAEGEVATNAEVYLRISLIGLPALFATMAGTGYLRGLQDTRTPLVVAVTTSIANLVIQIVLIEGFDQGIGASALATVIAQTGGAVVYLSRVVASGRALGVSLRPDPATLRRLAVVGRDLFVRTAALRGSLVVATAVAARIGVVPLAGHQIAFELWSFLALALDAIAIAGQAITGRRLGAGDVDGARAAARRMLVWGLIAGVGSGLLIAAVRVPLAGVFTDDAAVVAVAAGLLWWVAALQPANALVFVLDGVLIGAGDLRFLAQAMLVAAAAFLVAAGLVLGLDLGIGWLWAALGVLMAARLAALGSRFGSGHWSVPGGVHP